MNSGNEIHNVMKDIGFSLITEGKTVRVKADGYSMYPSIKPGFVIFIEPVMPDTVLIPGEIVAWKRDMGFVVHRLIKTITKDGSVFYITRGDSCLNEDEPVSADKLVGRVTTVENKEGKALDEKELKKNTNYNINRIRVNFIVRKKKFFNLFIKGNKNGGK